MEPIPPPAGTGLSLWVLPALNSDMPQIAIITATPPGINPGMLACEATARLFAVRAGLVNCSVFFRLHHLAERVAHVPDDVRQDVLACCELGIPWQRLDDPSQLAGMVPLYWGDFLHMRRYLSAIAAVYPDGDQAVRNLLLLADSAEPVLRRAVSYGTSFLFNSTADFHDPEYGPAFRRFFNGLHHVQMRDALSAAVVVGLRRRPENCFGIDPAQLLALPAYAAEILGTANLPDADGRALVFVARARHSPGALAAFLGSLSQATGTDLCWLPWGDRLSFPFLEDPPSGMFLLPIENDVPFGRLAPLLRSVAAANFVVTDTYHLAVVAWALGVPAIVLAGDYHEGERAGKQVDLRVRHDKRKVLLAQDGLLDFFVEPALIADPTGRAAVVERLAATMADPECGPSARRRLAERAASSEAALVEAIAQSQTS